VLPCERQPNTARVSAGLLVPKKRSRKQKIKKTRNQSRWLLNFLQNINLKRAIAKLGCVRASAARNGRETRAQAIMRIQFFDRGSAEKLIHSHDWRA